MRPTTRVVGFDDLDTRLSYDLWRLRQQVFVVEQGSPYPDLDGRDLEPATRHVLLEEEGTLVGCLRLVDDGDAWRIGRVVVAAQARGRGLARLLMDEAVARCAGREVRLDAQTGLTAFYEAYGFEVSGPEFVEDGVAHVPMTRRTGGPRTD
ncbi:GNAT family N-acetyltransferase [Nocardioides seonyuensis]|uniref:GNAT family N-acetyltransferase n=1 Tax=Nocardioides seonyuensis TaxID=2518371 RepID=A0A4P7ICZ8_9ACTN|nr:GNAT family N-acetyltransferase [Nocardioides seonyuensis]QBX54986.1 GNAT family N-acetyltransferase [Nocardioides seonyuensis]